jgi:uncharacterized membrane protein
MQRNVSGIERAASVAAGLLLMTATRRTRGPALATALGAGLMARGLSGYCPINAATRRGGRRRDDTRKALGGPRGVHVTESIVVRAPREEVYAFWRSLSSLPRFMTHLERIDVTSDTRSHWVTSGPAGTRMPGAEVASAGSVHFHETAEGGTGIRVRLQYDPPAGKVGAWLSALLGEDPAQQIREDLQRLRELFDGAASPTAPTALARDRLQVQPEVG